MISSALVSLRHLQSNLRDRNKIMKPLNILRTLLLWMVLVHSVSAGPGRGNTVGSIPAELTATFKDHIMTEAQWENIQKSSNPKEEINRRTNHLLKNRHKVTIIIVKSADDFRNAVAGAKDISNLNGKGTDNDKMYETTQAFKQIEVTRPKTGVVIADIGERPVGFLAFQKGGKRNVMHYQEKYYGGTGGDQSKLNNPNIKLNPSNAKMPIKKQTNYLFGTGGSIASQQQSKDNPNSKPSGSGTPTQPKQNQPVISKPNTLTSTRSSSPTNPIPPKLNYGHINSLHSNTGTSNSGRLSPTRTNPTKTNTLNSNSNIHSRNPIKPNTVTQPKQNPWNTESFKLSNSRPLTPSKPRPSSPSKSRPLTPSAGVPRPGSLSPPKKPQPKKKPIRRPQTNSKRQ